jgi:cell wall-associated NlpC family hydrolase
VTPLNTRLLLPRLLIASFALCLTGSVTAQSSQADSRQTRATVESNGSTRLENDISAPVVEEQRSRLAAPRIAGSVPSTPSIPLVPGRFDRLLLTAIEGHLGSPYHYAGTGPDAFDCSGFVWRTFQEAGFDFSRGPASSYWATFAPATETEEGKFGTLVFFSGLAHVGIVADEKGFYHASRHHGVIYSPFNEYWLSRIDGFRRVPLDSMPAPAAAAKPRTLKPPTKADIVDEDDEP